MDSYLVDFESSPGRAVEISELFSKEPTLWLDGEDMFSMLLFSRSRLLFSLIKIFPSLPGLLDTIDGFKLSFTGCLLLSFSEALVVDCGLSMPKLLENFLCFS